MLRDMLKRRLRYSACDGATRDIMAPLLPPDATLPASATTLLIFASALRFFSDCYADYTRLSMLMLLFRYMPRATIRRYATP